MKIKLIIIAVVTLFLFSGIALAAAKFVSGDVTVVDAKANTFTIKTSWGEIICEVSPKAEIKSGKESKTLSDVKVGDRITCRYEVVEGKRICFNLYIKTAEK
ncbi:MAG: hypothetical protein HY096_01160 [Nitrospinae bacterium]|nr:hypothetical protein [Nitrospinota bacterium]